MSRMVIFFLALVRGWNQAFTQIRPQHMASVMPPSGGKPMVLLPQPLLLPEALSMQVPQASCSGLC